MCRSVRCKKCGKTTWTGCGRHVSRVRASVPSGRWCSGHTADPKDPNGTWLARILGR
ncbi:hypothetical protein FB381_4240 [Nocardioides albertanoniae]|uniref:Uncharacterized protein n=1 Tax=Nocardioides albertanoniae TaxID=1175486 RepID=A0A543ACP3_9ACTN|nr:hypothetical protein [Nocardioides albertanoniae]TQL70310.1 hypothetical protein FB381_4240 [Nocardioides albertanoniae]